MYMDDMKIIEDVVKQEMLNQEPNTTISILLNNMLNLRT